MSPELDEVLMNWLVRSLHLADRVPSPAEPVDAATEEEADRFLHRVIGRDQWEDPSPEVASALIFRLRYAKYFGSVYESGLRDPLGPPIGVHELLEELLVKGWHQTGRPSWLRGDWT